MAGIERVPLDVYDGIKLPSFPVIRKEKQAHLDRIRNLESRDTDILLCSYMSSGFNWTSEIIGMLFKGKAELSQTIVGTFIELSPSLADLNSSPDPRFLKTHLPIRFLPKKHLENNYRMIHVIRNPKDVCLSYRHHTSRDPFCDLDIPWDEFLDRWIAGDVPYGSWFTFVKELEELQKIRSEENFLLLYYEDLHLKPKETIKRLAEFLKVSVSDEVIDDIIAETKFKTMTTKKKDPSAALCPDGKGFIYRKGIIGDWKDNFTASENERLDKVIDAELKGSSYKFIYEN